MQFVIIAHDYKEEGLQRRLQVREQHIQLGDKLKKQGKALYGVTLFDEKGNMAGSVYVVDFPSRKELDEYLKIEPYVLNNVWETVEIIPCKIGPSFIANSLQDF